MNLKKIKKNVVLPSNSYGIILGIGISYRLTTKLAIDFLYLFKYDNTIVNTHHFIAGLVF